MKRSLFVAIAFIFITACNQKSGPKTEIMSAKDSSLVQQVQQKDSSIMAYVSSINNIQHSIDTLMMHARILKKQGTEPIPNTNTTMYAEFKAIDSVILKDKRRIIELERKLKNSNESNDELVDLGENLSKQLNEKDSEIAAMQTELAKTRASLGALTKQLNDSLDVMTQQRTEINIMKIEGNTVYYIVGTEDDLVKKGLIVRKGGVIGLGRVPVLSETMSIEGLTKADLTQLHDIPLGNYHLVQLVTLHPAKAYKETGGYPDKLIITDPQDFWSKSKYLVAIVQ